MNSPSSAFGADAGQSPSAGRFGSGELNILVNSPAPDARGGGEVGFAGAEGAGGALNILVNSPGPDTRDDEAWGICEALLGGVLGSAEAAGRDALNMLVNSPGPDTRDDDAGVACTAGLAGSLGPPKAPAAGR